MKIFLDQTVLPFSNARPVVPQKIFKTVDDDFNYKSRNDTANFKSLTSFVQKPSDVEIV